MYGKIECRTVKSFMTTGAPLDSDQGPLMPEEGEHIGSGIQEIS